MFGDGALLFREFAMGEVRAYHQRRGKPKSFTDLRDIAVLFLAFPELKMDPVPYEIDSKRKALTHRSSPLGRR